MTSTERAATIRRWAWRKTDADLLATLDRVSRTNSTVIRAALLEEARTRGLVR